MEIQDLTTEIRTEIGGGSARALRRQGKVPAVLYGPHREVKMLSLAARELEQVLKAGTTSQLLLNLKIQDSEASAQSVMIKELQTHPVSGNVLHVDFYEFDPTRKIRTMIPVNIVGKSKGVENGGILQVVRHELEVLCLPTEIPSSIEVDITELDFGDAIHVNEVPVPGNAEILDDANYTVVTVVSPKREGVLEEDLEEAQEETPESAGE